MTIYFLHDKYGDDLEMSFDKDYIEWRKETLEGLYKRTPGAPDYGLNIRSYTEEEDKKKVAYVRSIVLTGQG